MSLVLSGVGCSLDGGCVTMRFTKILHFSINCAWITKISFFRCKTFNVCFINGSMKSSKFMSRDAGICRQSGRNTHICPHPLDPFLINRHCERSILIAMKTIYLCKFEWLLPLLFDPHINVKVLHLVRDPRSTINSRNSHKPNVQHLE